VAFTVKRLDQVQTFEAHNGFQLATLAQTPGMNLRLNKLTGRIKLHEHPHTEHFLYLIKGELELTVGSETRIIGSGHLITIPKGTPHAMKRLGAAEALFLDIASPPDVGDVRWHE
jgi:mannose-6-phosphate isomerase-like protein (cupin superfamily)